MPDQPTLFELPYAVIEKVATRTQLRNNKKVFTQTARFSFTMALNKIKERDGFNCRYVYDEIRELADDIFAKGQIEPLLLDVLPNDTALIDEGHRRYRAFMLNVELGRIKKNHPVEFYLNNTKVTELERMVRQMTSNTNLKKDLKPFEQAKVAWNVKNLYSEKPLSHEKVAEYLHVSRQTVDNLIKIAEADDRMRQEMITADMNMKQCLELVNSKKKLKNDADKAELEANKNQAGVTPAPFDPNAKDLAELKAIEGEVNEDIDDQDNDLPLKEDKVEETPEAKEIREAKEHEELLKIADEVVVKKLKHHLDKKIAKAVRQVELKDLVDEDGGELKENQEIVSLFLNKGTVITADIIQQLQDKKVHTVFLFKPGCEPVAASVFTVEPEVKAKDKYDMQRPEIAQVQNIIKLTDKLEFQVGKMDIPDGAKKDVADIVKWIQKDAQELREWVHANKKQNKIR